MNDNQSSRPFETHEVADYKKRRYRGLDQRLVDNREQRLFRRFLGRSESGRFILDLPCGYGRFTEAVVGSSPGFLISADLSEAMVREALKTPEIPPHRQGGMVVNAKQGLPLKSRSLNGIVSLRFFHHLHEREDRLAVLREYARVTDDWIILTYYRSNPLHVLQRKIRRIVKKSRTRIKMLSRREFEGEIEKAGLAVIGTRALFRGIHAQHFMMLKKKTE